MQHQCFIERKQYMQQLRDLKDQNIIKVITGVRRCGKSTLLTMFSNELVSNGVDAKQIQFYNFEDLDILSWRYIPNSYSYKRAFGCKQTKLYLFR